VIDRNIFSIISEYRSKAPVDVYGLAEEIGIKVLHDKNISDSVSGTIERNKYGQYVIRVNSAHSETRKRFTVAHELGHYIYHREQIDQKAIADNRLYRRLQDNPKYNDQIDAKEETQANRFAATLLMPYDVIVQLKNEGNSCDQIADKLIVSKQAMKIRYDAIFPNG
jgi:Zn-dependent peptidase ImmA (M78 family)